jgi:hypothetical protein
VQEPKRPSRSSRHGPGPPISGYFLPLCLLPQTNTPWLGVTPPGLAAQPNHTSEGVDRSAANTVSHETVGSLLSVAGPTPPCPAPPTISEGVTQP